MIGLEIAKAQYNGISDIDLVQMLYTDVALMKFCGFKSPIEVPSINPTSLTKFRNRLTTEILQEINEATIVKMVRNLPKRKQTQVISDTTCLPSNISFPTDTKLLATTVNKLTSMIKTIKGTGVNIINRGARKLSLITRKFETKRIKSTVEIKKVKRLLINQIKRQVRLIKPYIKILSRKNQEITKTAKQILQQQILIIKGKKVKERIVSFHEHNIRPIYRGKLKQSTEFGKKVALQIIGSKFILPTKASYNNFSDTQIPQTDIQIYNRIFKRYPKEYSFDRGGHTPENHKILEDLGIADGIQYRGKIPKKNTLPPRKTRKRLFKQRSIVEGKIGTLKTRYGMDRIRYKADNTEVRWHLGILLHNYTRLAQLT